MGVGADLEPGTLLQAYSTGLFPMDVQPEGILGWWSPDPRAVLPLDALRVTRSLRKSMGHFSVTRDGLGSLLRSVERQGSSGWALRG